MARNLDVDMDVNRMNTTNRVVRAENERNNWIGGLLIAFVVLVIAYAAYAWYNTHYNNANNMTRVDNSSVDSSVPAPNNTMNNPATVNPPANSTNNANPMPANNGNNP